MIVRARSRLAPALVSLGIALLASLLCLGLCASAYAAPLNLETLTGTEAEKLLGEGKITSVELVKSYEARIAALNKSGPGLNAVTQINPLVMEEAKKADEERSKGHQPRSGDGPADPAQGHHRRDADVHLGRRLGAARTRSPKRTPASPQSCVHTAS